MVIKILEAKVILEGIKSIRSTCMQNQISLQVELDSIAVVKALLGEKEDLSELKIFTDEIISLTSSLNGGRIPSL